MNRHFWYSRHDIEWLSWIPEPTLQHTVVLLFMTLAVGHLLVWRRVGGPTLWGLIEYTWLGVATISILTAVGEYRRTVADDELPYARLVRRIDWDRANEAVETGIGMLSQLSRGDSSMSQGRAGGCRRREPLVQRRATGA